MKKSNTQPHPDCVLHDRSETFDLELPDAPDFVSRRSRYGLARVMEFLEEYRAMFPPNAYNLKRRQERRCTEEFVL